MNSQQRIRLLDLFPVEALRDSFAIGGQKEAVLMAAARAASDDILNFAASHFHITKQHVYAFENPHGKVSVKKTDILLDGILVKSEVKNGELKQFYLAKEVLDFVVEDQNGGLFRESMELLWPIQIHLKPEYMLVRCTILERDVSEAFPGKKIVGSGKKQRDEGGIMKEIFDRGLQEAFWSRLDMNKAIKTLWDKDAIDALQARYKKTNSVSVEDMDKDRMLKRDQIEDYKKLVQRPVHGCVFLFLDNQDQFGRGFYCNPTFGELRFQRYCRGLESTDHVLRTILDLNF